MFALRFHEGCKPAYMTSQSAAADLVARTAMVVEPGQVVAVPAGVWIESYDAKALAEGEIGELQIRARSGLAFKHNICLANGIGTIDADYRDEICVLLVNHGKNVFYIQAGDRIAQMVLNIVRRLPQLQVGKTRSGGFGSTGIRPADVTPSI